MEQKELSNSAGGIVNWYIFLKYREAQNRVEHILIDSP